MIVAVGSGKGSPGATTLSVALGLVWPSPVLVAEADPRGADLPYRLTGPDGSPLGLSPSILTVAVDARPGATRTDLSDYAQPTALGLRVIVGEPSAERFRRLLPHLPTVTAGFAAWSGTVITDIGLAQISSPTFAVAGAASAMVVVTRADTESLAHARDVLADLTGPPGSSSLVSPVLVVVRADRRETGAACRRVERLIAACALPVTVAGAFPDDPRSAASLRAGRLPRRGGSSPLLGAARSIATSLAALDLPAVGTATAGMPVTAAPVEASVGVTG